MEKRPLTNSSRTPSDDHRPVVLQPVQPELADTTPTDRFQFVKPTRSQLNMLAVLALLGLAVVFWFVGPQDWITPNTKSVTTGISDDARNSKNRSNREIVTPFRDSQLERAQDTAQDIIDEFTEYQDVIEKNQYGTEAHLKRYSEILDRANNGDLLFGERKFDESTKEYELALEEIKQLLDNMSTEYAHWFEQGVAALEDRDYETSVHALTRAQAIEPLNEEVQARLDRVNLLPQVNELIRESERAKLKEEWTEALGFLDELVQLDPLTKGITERREEILEHITTQSLRDALTEGHEQLAVENYDAAEQTFNRILVDYPDNVAAKTGLEQVGRARLNAAIEALRIAAEEKENELDMRGALKIYEEALNLDSSLQFANEGRQRVFEIISVINAMNLTMQDPDALSADDTYDEAKKNLETAKTHRGHSAEYDALLSRFTNLVEYAGSQLLVVLISDDETEVTLTTSHRIGSFQRHELSLRPGRYTLHGSRDGWVDVRKTFVVERDMEPVSILCEEQI